MSLSATTSRRTRVGSPEPDTVCRHSFDRAVYELSVRPCLPDVLAVARRILGSDDLAWDALQEALLALWNLPELPPDVSGWMVRATVHRSLHVSRSERRRRTHERCSCIERPELRPELDPSLVCDAAERAQILDRAMDGLDRDQAQVLILREREGLGYEAIAKRLEVPIGTVRSRLSRARRALAERLDDLRVDWVLG